MSGDMSNIYKQGGGGEIMKWNKIKINARLINKTEIYLEICPTFINKKNIEIKNTGGFRSEDMHGDTECHECIISSRK